MYGVRDGTDQVRRHWEGAQYMRMVRPTIALRRIALLSVASALLLATLPAYADNAPPPAPAPAPAPAPTPKPAPTPTPTKPTTKTPTRTPATGDSAVTTPVDPKTEAFRKRLAEQQARLDAFLAQLDKLDEELAIATDDYDRAAEQLDLMRNRVKVAQSDLDKAQKAYQTQANLLSEQAKSIYRNGSFATVDVILGSKNFADLVTRVKFLNAMGLHQADVLASLRGQRDLIERQLNDLASAQKEAEQLEFEMRSRRIEIMFRIQDRQQMMSSAQSDLQVLLQREAARRQVEQEQLLSSIVSGTNTLGIEVVPGSPVETVLAYHGVPYVWGGETTAGFDCSGLLKYVFAQHGVKLPHYALSQFMMGEKVAVADLQPGDAVFFGSPVHHVGIYIGGGYFIHAPRTGDYVKISRLSDRYDYAGARRYAWVARAGEPLNATKSTTEALSAGWR